MAEKTSDRLARLTQGHFDILVNAANELMIVFLRTGDEPKDPLFIYDGKSRAFLFKNSKNEADKVFTEIPTEAWATLNAAKDILCVEVDQEHIFSEYTAKVEVRQWQNENK